MSPGKVQSRRQVRLCWNFERRVRDEIPVAQTPEEFSTRHRILRNTVKRDTLAPPAYGLSIFNRETSKIVSRLATFPRTHLIRLGSWINNIRRATGESDHHRLSVEFIRPSPSLEFPLNFTLYAVGVSYFNFITTRIYLRSVFATKLPRGYLRRRIKYTEDDGMLLYRTCKNSNSSWSGFLRKYILSARNIPFSVVSFEINGIFLRSDYPHYRLSFLAIRGRVEKKTKKNEGVASLRQ